MASPVRDMENMEDNVVTDLAADLLNSNCSVEEWGPLRELRSMYHGLQYGVQEVHSPAEQALNDNMSTYINTIADSVQNVASMRTIQDVLRGVNLPPEVTNTVNQEGGQIMERTINTIQYSMNEVQRNEEILTAAFNERQEARQMIKRLVYVGLSVAVAAGAIGMGFCSF